MYTILIAEPELYSVGVFMILEHAEAYKKDNNLPEDALVIETKEVYGQKKAPKCLGGKDGKRNRVFKKTN